MSSLPLISHHLFVAAVKEKSWAPCNPYLDEAFVPTPPVGLRLPVELIEFGRPLPFETPARFNILQRMDFTST
jgi:hypothetical protein